MTPARPNIVLVHCHDLGNWLPCYGFPAVPSPNLQRFAESGVVFEDAYATAPLCTPARSSLFTGLLPHQNGLMGLTHAGWAYRPGVRTAPEVLADAGYHSVLIGLQHEDFDPRVLGYDEVHGLGFLPRAMEVAHRTEKWFEAVPADTEPLFVTIGMWEVHRPWPEEDYEPADPASVTVPPYLPDNESTRRDISQFYGSIRQMDEAFGRILRAVERSAVGDNTMVVFTTDHGVAFPRAKSTLYDSGVNVSLIVRPSRSLGVAPGRRSGLVSHLDLVPTFRDLAGMEPDAGLEGTSLLPVLRDPSAVDQDRALVLEKTYHDRYDPIRGLRTSTYKYIRNFAAGPRLPLPIDLEESWTRQGMGDDHLAARPEEELYDLRNDPAELRDVSQDPERAAVLAQMRAALESEMRRTGDPLLTGDIGAPPAPQRA